MHPSPTITKYAQTNPPGRGRLRPQSVYVPPTQSQFAQMQQVVDAIGSGPKGFIDVPRLPQVGSGAQLILADDEGKLFTLDTSGATPVVRPFEQAGDENPANAPSSPAPGGGAAAVYESNRENVAKGDVSAAVASASGPEHGFGAQVLNAAGQQLASQFAAILAGGGAPGATLAGLLDPGNLVSDLGAAALQNLTGMLMGSLMGSLFGNVTDASSMGAQLAAHFGPQVMSQAQGKLMELAKQAFDDNAASPDTLQQIETFFMGVKSAASVPLGKGVPAGGDGHVIVKGNSALHLGDNAEIPGVDKGPYVEGNSKVLINGTPAVGKGHKAIGLSKGTPMMPLNTEPTVLMGLPPPPAPATADQGKSPAQSNAAGKQLGDECNPDSAGEADALAESEESGGLGRPLVCEPNMTKESEAVPGGGVVTRPPSWEPAGWAKSLFGIENTPTPDGIDDWSLLWGAIDIGSPQQPGAGTAATWWVPDKIFGYDMSPYFLRHDEVYSDKRTLDEWRAILGAEADAFSHGTAGNDDPTRFLLQVIYSSATASAGFGNAAANTVKGAGRTPPRH